MIRPQVVTTGSVIGTGPTWKTTGAVERRFDHGAVRASRTSERARRRGNRRARRAAAAAPAVASERESEPPASARRRRCSATAGTSGASGEVAARRSAGGREIARAEQGAEQAEGAPAQDLCHASRSCFVASAARRASSRAQRPRNSRLRVQKMPLAAAVIEPAAEEHAEQRRRHDQPAEHADHGEILAERALALALPALVARRAAGARGSASELPSSARLMAHQRRSAGARRRCGGGRDPGRAPAGDSRASGGSPRAAGASESARAAAPPPRRGGTRASTSCLELVADRRLAPLRGSRPRSRSPPATVSTPPRTAQWPSRPSARAPADHRDRRARSGNRRGAARMPKAPLSSSARTCERRRRVGDDRGRRGDQQPHAAAFAGVRLLAGARLVERADHVEASSRPSRRRRRRGSRGSRRACRPAPPAARPCR